MKNVIEYLEHTVKQYPDKTAFADALDSISYIEVESRSGRIASGLLSDISHGSPVAVFMEKGVNTVCAFLGIVRAGGFYVLLDPKQPTARLQQILDTLEPEAIVYDEKYGKALNRLGYEGALHTVTELMESERDDAGLLKVREQALDVDPLYCIFTSGSTGVPKGVLVSHRSVIDFIDCFTELFDITEQDVIGNQAPFDFDVSVKDIYSTLKTGATMQIIPKQFFSFPTKLLDFLCEREVTTLIWAVSALCIVTTLKGFEYKIPDKIRKVMFSGEAMPIHHLNEWRRHIPEAMYVNLYGPTEITCNCTYYIIDRTFEGEEVLPMGGAFPNEKVFLLDEEDCLVTETDKRGELCVSGTALALGYYRNQEQTQKAFVQNPLNDKYMEMIYRTGDLAYYNSEGLLCFAGRRDFQIKHMGHRIELGEIENALEAVKQINRALCIFDENHNKIVAFYQGEITKKDLTRILGKTLPPYMIPNAFCQIEAFPLTKNGKADRKELMRQYED